MSLSLYEMTNDIKILARLVESSDEITPEVLADTMEGMRAEFSEKINSVLVVRQNYVREAEMMDREIDRLSLLAERATKKATQLKQYVFDSMQGAKVDKVNCALFKVTLRKASKRLGAINEDLIPPQYWRIIPETRAVDKKALLEAAKENPIKGVDVIDGVRSLTIK